MEKREPSYTVGGNINWYNHYGEQNGGPLKKIQTINPKEDVEKIEPSYTVGGNINWYNCCAEQYGSSLKNKK